MTAGLEQRVGDHYMTGGHPGGAHAAHGTGKRKKRHEDIGHEAQKLYDEILDEAFDEDWHLEATDKHNNAYFSAVGELKGKKFTNRADAEEALVDALLKYKTEAGLPVSKDKGDRYRLHGEVLEFLDAYAKENKTSVDRLVKGRNLHRVLEAYHERELNETISKKVGYEVNKRLPHGEDPDFYQDVVKAHGNYTGNFYSKGKLARLGNRDGVMASVLELYGAEITRRLDEKEAPKESHGHGASTHH